MTGDLLDFQWKSWRVVVTHDRVTAAALDELNRGLEDGAANDPLLAFPAFHFDQDAGEVYAESQPGGDPLRLALDVERLGHLSSLHANWKFRLSAMGEEMWTWLGGEITNPEVRVNVERFLAAARAFLAQPKLDAPSVDLVVHVTGADSQTLVEAGREAFSAGLLGELERSRLEVGSETVAIVSGLTVAVSPEWIRVKVVLAAAARGRSVRGFIHKTSEALFGLMLPDEFDARLLIGGVEVCRATHATELMLLAPTVAVRLGHEAD